MKTERKIEIIQGQKKLTKREPNIEHLTESDIIQMIQENSMSDKNMLNILQKIRKKFGTKFVAKNIARKLKERK